VAFPLCAFAFLIWIDTIAVRRVVYVSGLGGWSEQQPEPATGTASPAGHVARENWLIVPGHNNDSYHWIAQTQQMLASGEWRVRHIDYENAPFGRDVYAASPYRSWLAMIAWFDHVISGRPLGLSVERAALLADPLLHLLLLAGTTIFVAWRLGVFPAALLSIGLATLFPFVAEFLPGMPDDHGLVQACAIWSVLPLLVGVRAAHSAAADTRDRARRWFFAAGVTGGLGLWISVPTQVPILIGIALGAPLAAWVARGEATEAPIGAPGLAPWSAWALGGAVTCLGAYLIEYFPAHLGSWHLRAIHPLYGLAWLGLGLLMTRATVWIQQGRLGWSYRDIGLGVLAAAAIATVPVVMWKTKSPGLLAADLQSSWLTKLSGGPDGSSLWAWMVNEGITLKTWTTVLPALLVLPAVWLILSRRTGVASRASLAIALGPVLVAIGIACRQLIWWNMADGVLLALLIAANVAIDETIKLRFARWGWSGLVALVLLLGVIQMVLRTEAGMKNALDGAEIYGLIERDLARWLALHAGARGAVTLASHNQATTLYYYGGLRGLGAMSWDNQDGLGAAIRILSATTPEEAKELVDLRGITHFVIPSWDSYFDAYTRMGIGKIETTFYERLAYWRLPPWLKPVPYQLPTIAGLEGQSVTILEVVDDQDDVAALSRLAEYFVEMGQLEAAAFTGQSLRRFPADPGALAARAQVEIARGDTASFDRTVESLQRRLSSGADRAMPWDRRVSLAVVLARGKQVDLARDQVRRCLAEVDEAKLRWLTTGSLYRLQVLGKAFDMAIADQRLRGLALDLLPGDLRSRL
jgi:hypothetical protein